MSLISSVKEYIKTYTGLTDGAPVWVDYLGDADQYSVNALPGNKILEQYLDGKSLRAFPFALQSQMLTPDEAERLDNIGFFEVFSDWLEQQTFLGNFPTLDAGKTPLYIEATSWGFLYIEGQSDTGIYQLSAQLVYEQDAIS